MRIKRDRCCLLVVDVQSRLLPAVEASGRVLANAAILLKAAARLGVPVLLSEQYPKGLGPTVAELTALAPPDSLVEKQTFSCAGDDRYRRRFEALGRRQAVIAGIEAHVCVLQTALDLIEDGRQVFVVADATSSRTAENARLALDRLRVAGADIVTTEMVVFEWLDRAGTPEFRELSRLIK